MEVINGGSQLTFYILQSRNDINLYRYPKYKSMIANGLTNVGLRRLNEQNSGGSSRKLSND